MPLPIVYAANALEGAVFTLTPDGAVTGRGVERLADRDIGLECEDAGTTGTRTWPADRGLGAAAADDRRLALCRQSVCRRRDHAGVVAG